MKTTQIKLLNIVKSFNLQVVCGEDFLDREINGGYASDLLSDVMANTKKGDIWSPARHIPILLRLPY